MGKIRQKKKINAKRKAQKDRIKQKKQLLKTLLFNNYNSGYIYKWEEVKLNEMFIKTLLFKQF